MSDRERIIAIMQDKKLTNTLFSQRTGITPGSVTQMLKGNTKPSLDVFRKIKSAFPEINTLWLYEGEGEMYKSDSSGISSPVNSEMVNPEAEAADLFSQASTPSASPSSSPKVDDQFRVPFNMTSQFAHQQSVVPQVDIKDVVGQVVEQIQKPQRKVVEVRIFYSDGTYESFGTN